MVRIHSSPRLVDAASPAWNGRPDQAADRSSLTAKITREHEELHEDISAEIQAPPSCFPRAHRAPRGQ
jgi:hypothetical protein